MKQKTLRLIIALFAISIWGGTCLGQDVYDLNAQGFNNGDIVTTINGTNSTITFAKGTSSTSPAYYETGSAVRFYGGNTLTIASENNITKIEFIYSTEPTPSNLSVTPGTYDFDSHTWTGNSKEIVLSNTAKSGNFRFLKITVTLEGNTKEPTTVSFGENDGQTIEVTEGQETEFGSPTATLTPTEAGSITYSSDNENVAKVDATTGAITFGTEFGTAKITASFAGNDTYGSSSASYIINYMAKKVAGQVTFDYDKGAFDEVKANSYYDGTATFRGDDEQSYTFTLKQACRLNGGLQMKANSGAVISPVFEFANGYKVIVTCKTNNVNISSGDINSEGQDGTTELDITSPSASFTIETGNKYAVVSRIEIIPFTDAQKTATSIKFPQNSYTLIDTEFDSPKAILTDIEGQTIEDRVITYSISGDDIATIDANTGTVTIKDNSYGTATIKASFAGDETYSASSGTYTLTILKIITCNSIADVKAQEPGTMIKLNINNAQVIYATDNDVFIKDATGAIDMYQMDLGILTTGKIVNGNIIATYKVYNNLPELTKNDYTSTNNLFTSDGDPVKPIELSTTTDIANYICDLVTISGTINNGCIDDVKLFDKFGIKYATPADDANVEVTGIVVPFKDVTQICPTSTTSIVFKMNESEENSGASIVSAEGNASVALTRTLSSEYWNTFCVPFSMTVEQVAATFGEGTKITEFDGTVDGTIMNFEESATIEAGVPYLIKPAQTTTNPRISGVTLTAAEAKAVNSANGYAFCGTYSPKALATDGTDLFVTTEGKLNMPTAEGNTIKGMRAYITVPAGSDVKTIMLNIAGTLVGIDEIVTENADNGKIYNLNGQYVGNNADSLNKGLYIKNGKKVIIK